MWVSTQCGNVFCLLALTHVAAKLTSAPLFSHPGDSKIKKCEILKTRAMLFPKISIFSVDLNPKGL